MTPFTIIETEIGLGVRAMIVRVKIITVCRMWGCPWAVLVTTGRDSVGVGETCTIAARRARHRPGTG